MTVTVEVPEGHKWCKRCGGVFPKEAGFRLRKSVKPSTGTVSIFFNTCCKHCESEQSAKLYAQKQLKEVTAQNLDNIAEQISDACFSGEQVVYRHKGRIKWARYGATMPYGAEMLGRFNLGTDYRDLRGSLEA